MMSNQLILLKSMQIITLILMILNQTKMIFKNGSLKLLEGRRNDMINTINYWWKMLRYIKESKVTIIVKLCGDDIILLIFIYFITKKKQHNESSIFNSFLCNTDEAFSFNSKFKCWLCFAFRRVNNFELSYLTFFW
jgi:hypothetical protein